MTLTPRTRERPADPSEGGRLLVGGMAFLDHIFAGLSQPPAPGQERWATSQVTCPGGVATVASAAARAGARVVIAAPFGDDLGGEVAWDWLAAEGIDLGASRRVPGWAMPVTVAMSWPSPAAGGPDRAMVSHSDTGLAAPAGWVDPEVPAGSDDIAFGWLMPERRQPGWLVAARASGAAVVLDSGWDADDVWPVDDLAGLSLADLWVPNAQEAMRYLRATSVAQAAVAAARLVPVVVVKDGARGAVIARRGCDELTWVAAPTVPAAEVVDTTGAGDIFAGVLCAGLIEAAASSGRTVREVIMTPAAKTAAGAGTDTGRDTETGIETDTVAAAVERACAAASLSVRALGGAASAPQR